MVEIIEVTTPELRKEFVMLPFKLYKGNPYWVPPLIQGEIKNISPENPYFHFCDAKFWIARRDGRTVGRIGGIIHYAYIEKTQEKLARFTRSEFIDDAEVVDTLFATAENWAKEKGMTGIMGPLGFSNLDTQAMLIEGFDQMPSVASVYHLPYYHKHLERLGYIKHIDWIEFRLFLEKELPEKAIRLASVVEERYKLHVVHVKSKKELRQYGHDVFHLLNKSFYDLFSFVPLDDDMIDAVLDDYVPVINTDFVKLVLTEDNKVVGFVVPVPSLTRTMQIANGKLGPRSILSLLWSRRHNKVIDLFLTGVDPEYQNKGVLGLLIATAQKEMSRYGMLTAETTGMLENNQKAIQHWKNYNHIQNKRKRCFIKIFD